MNVLDAYNHVWVRSSDSQCEWVGEMDEGWMSEWVGGWMGVGGMKLFLYPALSTHYLWIISGILVTSKKRWPA
eukprot:SAG31_NODE_1483_length_8166_cov_5.059874_4_plen_73_part_00